MRNIYDLLNDVETSLDDYDVTPLSNLEQKRLQNMTKRIAGKQKYNGRWLGVACAAVFAIGIVVLAPADSPVYAAKENVSSHISRFRGIERNLD